ncbi:hypothetical protein CC86DRAFT_411002 [Ophiobolus disseminans]|uniref:Uncharacterized protein n=1 Tax=Ophiobolus disseminans TaxID=1469910 RepID=A0A6A6ZJM2_9PLEO|nr:hypothetical protein CC86DRAFT_411002 [Ophiobolus disseminans]
MDFQPIPTLVITDPPPISSFIHSTEPPIYTNKPTPHIRPYFHDHNHDHGNHLVVGLTFLILGVVAFFVVIGFTVRECLLDRSAVRARRREDSLEKVRGGGGRGA